MEVRLLGPLEARLGDGPVDLGPRKQRAVLAMLALEAGRAVPADRLAAGLWGERLPPSAAKMVQLYVSHLRRLFDGDGARIVTRGRGYELQLVDGEVDAERAERLLEEARPRDALALWRGEPLADLVDEPFAVAEIRRLQELRLRAAELAINADLAAGRHAEVIGELDALVAAHPLRERLHAQRMLALYRASRQSEALGAYRSARAGLVEQIGVEPGAELRRLHEQILVHDPALEKPAAALEPPTGIPADLPGGTVTFLISDIEGSTRLLAQLGERYADILLEHRRVLRAAFDAHGGREVHSEGDGFLVAFAWASDAIAAAVSAQQALARREWPDGIAVRVRIGVHTGEAVVRQDSYVGLAVHRAARICSAGHGGQILISGCTSALAGDDLPRDAALRDLGRYRLKDFDEPERLFQLVVGDLPADFPPVAAIAVSPGGRVSAGRLPPAPNRTIGREDVVRAIVDRLLVTGVRLLTLTGPGGVGKTRVALEAAAAAEPNFAEGAYFVSLAATARADHAASAIAQALKVAPLQRETPDQAVERFLAPKSALLVLDNFEHLLPAAPLVGALLARCDGLTVLATSREPLRLQIEHRYAVTPLAVPPGTGRSAVGRASATALFVERARSHDASFEVTEDNAGAVADICRRLDGLPLAIELAAARITLLDPDQLGARLGQALDVLGSGPRDAPDRQRTLRATIDWSHRLLTAPEAAALGRLSVFAGGASIEAAETVTEASLDTLEGLIDKGLVTRHGHGRLRMLETTRAYAAERLAAAPDRREAHARHHAFYVDLAREHGADQALMRAGRTTHLGRLDTESDNFDAALEWALREGDAPHALELCSALGTYWAMRFRGARAVSVIDEALGLSGGDECLEARVGALIALLWLSRPSSRAADIAVEVDALARESGDPLLLARALEAHADSDVDRGRFDAGATRAAEALYQANKIGDEWQIASAWRVRARASRHAVDRREHVERAAIALAGVGNLFDLGNVLVSAAYGALRDAAGRDAKAFAERALPVIRELDDPYMSMNLQANIGIAALAIGDLGAADGALREALELSERIVVPRIAAEMMLCLGALAAAFGDAHRAARLVGASATHEDNDPLDTITPTVVAASLNSARARYGAKRWDADARAGAALTLSEAIAYALQESTSPHGRLTRRL